jgi:hypothetical protein
LATAGWYVNRIYRRVSPSEFDGYQYHGTNFLDEVFNTMNVPSAPERRRLRPAARAFFACITAAGVASAGWHSYLVYNRMGAVSELVIDEARSRTELLAASKAAITGDYYNRRIGELIDDCDLATADSYVAVGEAQGLTLSAELQQAYENSTTLGAQAYCVGAQAGTGFITGEGASASHIGGAVLSDFLVYGDLRDIARQSYNFATGVEVDEFILILSGIGLAATAGTYFTAGIAAPARSAVSLVKFAKRTGQLTGKFAGHLAASLKRVLPAERIVSAYKATPFTELPTALPKALAKSVDQAEMAKLGSIFDDLSAIGRSTDQLTALRLLKHVETPADLAKLKVAAKIGGRQTLAWTDRFGAGLLKFVKPAAKLTARTIGEIVLLAFSAALALVSGLVGFGFKRAALFGVRRMAFLYRA